MTSTNQRRLVFAGVYGALMGLTFVLVRHVRPAAGVEGPAFLDWAPSFLVAFASPFLFSVIDPRLNRFGLWCLWLLIAQSLHEYEQQFSAHHRYDPFDLLAIVAGIGLSYLLHRWIARDDRPISSGRYTLDLEHGRPGAR